MTGQNATRIAPVIELFTVELKKANLAAKAIHDLDAVEDTGTLHVEFPDRPGCNPIELDIHANPANGIIDINVYDICSSQSVRAEIPLTSNLLLKIRHGGTRNEIFLPPTANDPVTAPTATVVIKNPKTLQIDYLKNAMYIIVW